MDVRTVTDEIEIFTCNAYLVKGEEPTLIDAGSTPAVAEAVGDHTDTLARVLLTHQHGDHIGGLDAVCDAFDPDCYAFAEHPRRTHAIADGEQVPIGGTDVEVLHTPGHAEDHVSFVGDEVLFSGDVVVYNDEAFEDGSFGRTDYEGQSRDELIDSIERLLDSLPADVSQLYAGHGDVYTGDVRTVIERALERARRHEPKYPDG